MGASYWEFNFTFTTDFSRIESGERKGFTKSSQAWKPASLTSMRKFGTDLVYRRATDQEIAAFTQSSKRKVEPKPEGAGPIASGSDADISDSNLIEFAIDGKTFQAEIIGTRDLVGKIKTNTHIRYLSGHQGREWIFLDKGKHTLNDEWGHANVPFAYVPGDKGPKRPLTGGPASSNKRAR